MKMQSFRLGKDPGNMGIAITDVFVVVGKRRPLTLTREDYAAGNVIDLSSIEAEGFLRSKDKGVIHKMFMSETLLACDVEVEPEVAKRYQDAKVKISGKPDSGKEIVRQTGGGTKMIEPGSGVWVGQHAEPDMRMEVPAQKEERKARFIEQGIGAGMQEPPEAPVVFKEPMAPALGGGAGTIAEMEALAAQPDQFAAQSAGAPYSNWMLGLDLADQKRKVQASADTAFLEHVIKSGPPYLRRLAEATLKAKG